MSKRSDNMNKVHVASAALLGVTVAPPVVTPQVFGSPTTAQLEMVKNLLLACADMYAADTAGGERALRRLAGTLPAAPPEVEVSEIEVPATAPVDPMNPFNPNPVQPAWDEDKEAAEFKAATQTHAEALAQAQAEANRSFDPNNDDDPLNDSSDPKYPRKR